MLCLLHMGVSTTARAVDGYTPLELACECYPQSPSFRAVVEYLWSEQRVRADTTSALCALSLASSRNSAECLQLLITQPSSLSADTRIMMGWTPLHFSAFAGSCETASFLLSCGASVTARCEGGTTPLHCAVSDCERLEARVSIVRMLLEDPEGGSVIDATTDAGFTPLAIAAGKGLLCCCLALINAGSQAINMTTNDGQTTPYRLAAAGKHTQLQELLVQHGAIIPAASSSSSEESSASSSSSSSNDDDESTDDDDL